MTSYTAHVTPRDGIPRRIALIAAAPELLAALLQALGCAA